MDGTEFSSFQGGEDTGQDHAGLTALRAARAAGDVAPQHQGPQAALRVRLKRNAPGQQQPRGASLALLRKL